MKKIIVVFTALFILSSLILPVCAENNTYKVTIKFVTVKDTDYTTEELDENPELGYWIGKNPVTGKVLIYDNIIDAKIDIPVDYTFADLRKYLSEKYGGEENDFDFMLFEAVDTKDSGAKAYKSASLCNDGAVIKNAMIKWYGKKNWNNTVDHGIFIRKYPSEMDESDYNNSNNPSTGDDALSVVPVILLSLSAAYCFGRKKKTA